MPDAVVGQPEEGASIPGIAALCALVPGDPLWNGVTAAGLEQAAEIWPLAILAHAVALALIFGIALATMPARGLVMPATVAAASLLLLGTQCCCLRARAMRASAPHIRVWAAVLLGGALGACLAIFQAEAGATLAPPALIVTRVALAATAGLIAVAMAPVRAALIAYLAAIALGLLAATGSLLAAAAAAFMLPIAGLVARRSLRGAYRERSHGHTDDAARGQASRLVAAHEAHGNGWFWETDRTGRLIYLSARVATAIARPGQAVIGSHLTEIFRLDSPEAETERSLAFHLNGRTSFSDYSVQIADGARDRWWSMSGRPVLDELGQFRGFIGSGGDLTERRRADAEISRMALFDGLTGLANRQRMRIALDAALAPLDGGEGRLSLFLLDLDRFKAVNDTLGHQVGDALLKQVAQRLTRSVGEAGLVGRLGGDEFQVVLIDEIDRDRLATIAGTVIAALSAPYMISGVTVSIGCSLGIAVAPFDGRDSETLIRNADLALYAAKAEGRGIHRFYKAQLLAAAQNRRQLEDDLREAFSSAQFHLVYQPVVSTKTARLVGYEALLRWNHPERGAISPADFVPIAEECGLIERIGEWALRTACAAAAEWPDTIRIGVNVSPIQFANPGLPAVVTSALAQSGIAPNRLELEITESVFLSDTGATARMFTSLKSLGVRLALDDFGTGYSSLGYLKQAPFDKIKIDQSFVRGAALEGSRNAAIIGAIVALADTLGMETTAEGVELQDEIELIRELGCSHIQGFVYGRPMPAADVLRQLGGEATEVEPDGFAVSRAPRIAMLRTAIVALRGGRQNVRIRNITARGAMIDGITLLRAGTDLAIEIFPGEPIPAQVQWARDGRMGLSFAEPIEIDRLIAAADAMLQRPPRRSIAR